MRVVVVIIACVAAVLAGPLQNGGSRIYYGELTTIDRYPFAAVLLFSDDFGSYFQDCGGSILNERTVLSAGFCFQGERALPERLNIRVGSTFANSGGVVHSVARIIKHPNYDVWTRDNDIAIVKTATNIIQSNFVRFIGIAGPNYFPADDALVWVAGWGATNGTFAQSEQLRHTQQVVVNQETCQNFFSQFTITDNMLCASGPSRPCAGDSGGPIVHNNVLVGVFSFLNDGCWNSSLPSTYARVSRFTNWTIANSS